MYYRLLGLCPWDSPGKNTGVGCCFVLQIFLTQGLNLHVLYWQTDYLPLIIIAHQNKTQFSPEPVPPIWKLAQASHPHPSEGRQTENHSQRKVTKLITRTTTLPNSMKLCAMPCRAIQDKQVIVESSDKTWSTKEGTGEPLQYSCLRTPWTVWKGKMIGYWKRNSPGQ